MGDIGDKIGAVFVALLGVAILAIIVSQQANTSGVIQSISSGFAGILRVALSPVTGSSNGGNNGLG